jgi:hypothetical protein
METRYIKCRVTGDFLTYQNATYVPQTAPPPLLLSKSRTCARDCNYTPKEEAIKGLSLRKVLHRMSWFLAAAMYGEKKGSSVTTSTSDIREPRFQIQLLYPINEQNALGYNTRQQTNVVTSS